MMAAPEQTKAALERKIELGRAKVRELAEEGGEDPALLEEIRQLQAELRVEQEKLSLEGDLASEGWSVA